jgi:hypothetical protein
MTGIKDKSQVCRRGKLRTINQSSLNHKVFVVVAIVGIGNQRFI